MVAASKIIQDVYYADRGETDRREKIRIIVNFSGRYSLASKRDINGDRKEFACRVVNMPQRGMALVGPVIGPINERVIVYLPRFGTIEGRVCRHFKHGFIMTISGNEEAHECIAAKLEWLENNKNHDAPDGRRYARIVLRNPWSILTLPDQSVLSCMVIDTSLTGAAVSADVELPAGSKVSVGKIGGRIVRRLKAGLAIKFDAAVSPHLLEEFLLTE